MARRVLGKKRPVRTPPMKTTSVKKKVSNRPSPRSKAKKKGFDADEIYVGETMNADYVGDQRFTVTVSDSEVVDFDDGEKVVLQFEEDVPTLPLNPTNYKRIKAAWGSLTVNWVGGRIELYTAETTNPSGEACLGVRVKIVEDDDGTDEEYDEEGAEDDERKPRKKSIRTKSRKRPEPEHEDDEDDDDEEDEELD